jgi:hypothetical protein
MPTSKKRGGKKAHNKRIVKRNENEIKQRHMFETQFSAMLQKQQLELQNKQTDETPGS